MQRIANTVAFWWVAGGLGIVVVGGTIWLLALGAAAYNFVTLFSGLLTCFVAGSYIYRLRKAKATEQAQSSNEVFPADGPQRG